MPAPKDLDRIDLKDLKNKFTELWGVSAKEGGYGKSPEDIKEKICIKDKHSFSLTSPHVTGGISELESDVRFSSWSESEMVTNKPITEALSDPGYMETYHVEECDAILKQGSIVIAAITSCTNTSNPSVMIAAGLLAKKAVEKGLTVSSNIKNKFSPGSRVVTDYLERTKTKKYLDRLGFDLVAYGKLTCIGNSGPLEECIENAIKEHDLIVASVLSGNRNFEAGPRSCKGKFSDVSAFGRGLCTGWQHRYRYGNRTFRWEEHSILFFLKDIWPSSPKKFQGRYVYWGEQAGNVQAKLCAWFSSNSHLG